MAKFFCVFKTKFVAKVKKTDSSGSSRKIRAALTPEARENQMISLAVDLAEKQLMEGTASSQVITHYLKLGSTKDARVETNSELQAIFKKEEEKELKRLNRRIEAIKEVYANH